MLLANVKTITTWKGPSKTVSRKKLSFASPKKSGPKRKLPPMDEFLILCDGGITTDSSVTLAEIEMWRVGSLKQYLADRGLVKTGTIGEPCACVFSCIEVKSAVEHNKQLVRDYRDLLNVEGKVISDPNNIPSKLWRTEEESMADWPHVLISDIKEFYDGLSSDGVELSKRLLCEYKENKAYRYYSSG
ncbi:unnamed protein product [Owenia fusiformis]|uniref:Uncharacterized protein n=1 Tax=Owenia fusiformis TaxID=6347 RepID=A0A8J1UQC6_OWEFU|nr:unnamed protein product [Owenia fusiformis]